MFQTKIWRIGSNVIPSKWRDVIIIIVFTVKLNKMPFDSNCTIYL